MQKNTQTKPKKSFKHLLLQMAVAVAGIYLAFNFISGQFKIAEKRRELNELSIKVAQQADINKELMRMMENDDDAAYVERVAREKLGFANPKERVFVDLTGE